MIAFAEFVRHRRHVRRIGTRHVYEAHGFVANVQMVAHVFLSRREGAPTRIGALLHGVVVAAVRGVDPCRAPGIRKHDDVLRVGEYVKVPVIELQQ